jgi:hypothetical protein
MERLLRSIGVVVALVTVGCGESVLDTHDPDRSPRVEAASAPTVVPIFVEFDDVNPCSGLVHTVTITGTARIVEHDGRTVVHSQVTVTTSSGFEGRGTETDVNNGNIQTLTLNHMLTNGSGDRIRAHFVLILDVSTTPPTVRATTGSVTCVGA